MNGFGLLERIKIEAGLDAILATPGFNKRSYLDKNAKLGTLRAEIHVHINDAIALVAAQFMPKKRLVLWSHNDEGDNHPTLKE
jgi:hypothetical protein